MLKLSKFGAYTAQKLAQQGGKKAQARLQCLLLFASVAGANADAGSLAVLSGLNIEQLKQTKVKSNLYCATLLNKILREKKT